MACGAVEDVHILITLPIRSRQRLITTYVQLYHGQKYADAYVALDTGATSTLFTPSLIRQLNLEPTTAPYRMVSATDVEMVKGYRLGCIQLGEEKLENIEVTAMPLPDQLQLDGLIGLNFLSHFIVTFDFHIMQVRMERIIA